MTEQRKFPKEHPYMKRLDEVLTHYYVIRVDEAEMAAHGEDYESMKELILSTLFQDKIKKEEK